MTAPAETGEQGAAGDALREPVAEDRSRGWRWLLVPLVLLLVAAALVPVGLWALSNTAAGRAFVARQLSGISLDSGIGFDVARIEGNVLSTFTMVDVVVTDLDGTLAVLPRVDVDWEPISLLSTGVNVNRLDMPEIRLRRMWRINPRDPDEPLLPDIDIRIGRFTIGMLVLEKPVLGREERLSALGRTDIRDGRMLLDLQATASRGDRLLLLVDAEPDRDRFDLKADFRGPSDGLVATAAGLGEPVVLAASGAGTWSRWRGRLEASVGEAPVADLGILAEDGRFRVTGDLTLAGLLPEAAGPLVTPAIALDATVERDGDRIDLNLVASSPALALTGSGGLDLEASRLIDGRAEVRVRQPGLVNPALSGSGLRLSVAADGPLATAPLAWTFGADQLRWAGANGPVGADAVRAEGQIRRGGKGEPLRIPFTASAGRLVGLPPEQAALAEAPRLSGTLLIEGETVRVPDFALRTARLTATGSAVRRADGRIEANVAGEVPRLAVEGLGPVAIRADARIAVPAGGGLAAEGRFEARSLGLSNASAADFLGGPPLLTGQFRLAPAGDILVTDARFQSPALSFAGASARYDPATGRFALQAEGVHRDYGPVSLVASGTAAAPVARIRMPRPGFGIGLSDLVADIAPAPAGIAWTVSGETPGGSLAGRGTVDYGEGRPLAIGVETLALGGVAASGRLVQTDAGPFAGTLAISGQGINGTLGFAAEGALQRIDARATARAARLPLQPPVVIGSGRLDLSVLLAPDRPAVRGTFEASNVRRDDLAVTTVSGQFNLVGSEGAGRITATGRSGDNRPFAATATVRSVPKGFALTLDGRVGRLPLKLERAAVIARSDAGWELQPVRLVLPSGTVVIAGTLGETRTLRLVLEDVGLSALNLVAPGLGLQGEASGQVNIRWDAGYPVPLGAANLTVKGFSRAGVTGLSVPVDLVVSARSSTAEGLLVGADMRWQGNQLGRLLLRVAPGPGETAEEQWRAGRLSGGVRYNGPVEPLWAFAGLEGQELKGPVAIGADFSGTVSDPVLNGVARGRGLLYRNVALGTEISQIAFDGRFAGPALILSSFTGATKGGSLSGSGRVNLSAGEAGSVDLSLELNRARLADSDTLSVTVSGPLALKGDLSQPVLSGELRVDDARIVIVPLESSEIPVLKVRRVGDVRVPAADQGRAGSTIRLDVRVQADDRIRVEGMGLDSWWRADMRVRGTATQPILTGSATLARGDFQFAGNSFDISRGRVVFNGAPMQTSIDILAETRANDVTAFVRIGGTAINPEVSFSSQPSLPEDEILSRLLFGTSVADLSVTEALQLATAIAGLQSGSDTMGKIRRSIGVDRLRLVGDTNAFGLGAGIAIGKRLGRNVYVEVITDSDGNTLATVQWSLSRTLSLLGEISSIGRNSLNLRYQRDY